MMTESRNSLKNGHQEAQEREENLRAEKDSNNNNNNNNSFVGTVVLELKSKFNSWLDEFNGVSWSFGFSENKTISSSEVSAQLVLLWLATRRRDEVTVLLNTLHPPFLVIELKLSR
jgi:hypothetical protein